MIFVGVGGCFGAIMRYVISIWISSIMNERFPWATFYINVSGSFLLGLCMGLDPRESIVLLCATGFLGAFTTFSTFSYEVVKLVTGGRIGTALLYVGSSVVLGISFAAGGYFLSFYYL